MGPAAAEPDALVQALDACGVFVATNGGGVDDLVLDGLTLVAYGTGTSARCTVLGHAGGTVTLPWAEAEGRVAAWAAAQNYVPRREAGPEGAGIVLACASSVDLVAQPLPILREGEPFADLPPAERPLMATFSRLAPGC